MKTPLQAAHDLLHVMTEVGQAECYLDDMRLIIEGLNQQYAAGYEAAKKQAVEIVGNEYCSSWDRALSELESMQPEGV